MLRRVLLIASVLALVPALAFAHPGHGPADPLAHALWHLFDDIDAVIAAGAVALLAALGAVRLRQHLIHVRR
jgi:hypothetical protein